MSTEDIYAAIVEAVAERCATSKFLLVYEDAVRAVILEAILARECAVRLPFPGVGIGTLTVDGATFLFKQDEAEKQKKADRKALVKAKLAAKLVEAGVSTTGATAVEGASTSETVAAPASDELHTPNKRGAKLGSRNSDLRIVSPLVVTLELKVRGEFGGNAQHNYDDVVGDLNRVVAGEVAFVLVADLAGYNAWRGIKEGTRGVKARDNFASVFPAREELKADRTPFTGKWANTAVAGLAKLTASPWKDRQRVVLAMWRGAA